jgi:hypothetical protein
VSSDCFLPGLSSPLFPVNVRHHGPQPYLLMSSLVLARMISPPLRRGGRLFASGRAPYCPWRMTFPVSPRHISLSTSLRVSPSTPSAMPPQPSYPDKQDKDDGPSQNSDEGGGSQVLTIGFLKCDRIHEASRPDHGTYEGELFASCPLSLSLLRRERYEETDQVIACDSRVYGLGLGWFKNRS